LGLNVKWVNRYSERTDTAAALYHSQDKEQAGAVAVLNEVEREAWRGIVIASNLTDCISAPFVPF
jgi:hypothetical protein